MNKKLNIAIMIGDFQPLTNKDVETIQHCLKAYDHTIIISTSTNRRISIKRPFGFEPVKAWINEIFSDASEQNSMTISTIKDFNYNKQKWVSQVQDLVFSIFPRKDNIFYIVDSDKKSIKENIKKIPNFFSDLFMPYPNQLHLSGPEIIEKWFKIEEVIDYVPLCVAKDLSSFRCTPYYAIPGFSKSFSTLLDEYSYYSKEKSDFSNYPYPNALKFYCADPVIVCNGSILLVQRAEDPGKDSWALPGGFVNADESAEDAMLRELVEETNLQVPSELLKTLIKSSHVFDNPNRNIGIPRVSNAFYIELFSESSTFPEVLGMDDAKDAKWIPLSEVRHMPLFDDHYDIIDFFTGAL